MIPSKIVFVDFHDSFSFNILSKLKSWAQVEIVDPSKANEYLLTHSRFVWGPGPGRADEYGIDLELLKASLLNKEHRHFGICLGHQLIGLALGGFYDHEDFPKHGTSEELVLPEWLDWGLRGEKVNVQSYNSLVVSVKPSEKLRVWNAGNKLMMLAGETFFSCQFHPESVGTSCPELIFGGVQRNFL